MDIRSTETATLRNPSRRRFLKTGGSAALVVGFALPTIGGRVLAADAAAVFAPNAYLRITPDDRITVVVRLSRDRPGRADGDPDAARRGARRRLEPVGVEQAPVDKAYANPAFGMQATGGSTTVRAHWEPLRKAGAAAREMLVAAAAAPWKADPASLRTQKARSSPATDASCPTAHWSPTPEAAGARARLAEGSERLQAARPAAQAARLARARPTAARATASMCNCPACCSLLMARAPMPGAPPARVDDAQAKAVKGVRQVLTIPSGVAVLADGILVHRREAATRSRSTGISARTRSCRAQAASEMLRDGRRQRERGGAGRRQPARQAPTAPSLWTRSTRRPTSRAAWSR